MMLNVKRLAAALVGGTLLVAGAAGTANASSPAADPCAIAVDGTPHDGLVIAGTTPCTSPVEVSISRWLTAGDALDGSSTLLGEIADSGAGDGYEITSTTGADNSGCATTTVVAYGSTPASATSYGDRIIAAFHEGSTDCRPNAPVAAPPAPPVATPAPVVPVATPAPPAAPAPAVSAPAKHKVKAHPKPRRHARWTRARW